MTVLFAALVACASATQQRRSSGPQSWAGAKDLRSALTVRSRQIDVDPEAMRQVGIDVQTFQPPRLVTAVNPVYPDTARRANAAGVVVLECVLGSDGRVGACKVTKSVHPDLDEAAIDSFVQNQYQPVLIGEVATAVVAKFEVNFRLK